MNDAKIKSDLQTKLESQGWEFLTNETINYQREGKSVFSSVLVPRIPPKSNYEIKREYSNLKKGFFRKKFKDVMVTEAYDIKGHYLPDLRAVYVKR